ncbi:hydroxymethylglutaryl-CoA lyase [Microbacteriaceae bacterium K1510]|nr:hydroxymethylglutaryl-CoA lyase [Microbacteriaceae bacterium K1510]
MAEAFFVSPQGVELVEVAPRDGFQAIATPLPTAEKIGVIGDLLAAGVRRMEVGSFVSPKAVPQMADIGAIAEAFRDHPDAILSVLVPNAKGAELALKAGCRALVYVLSVSEAHNSANVRRSFDESCEELRAVARLMTRAGGPHFRVDLATAFDCPFDGTVPLDALRRAVAKVLDIAPDAEIALCDTTGRASPFDVVTRFETVKGDAPGRAQWAFHGHDTFGMGVANALFAYRAGVKVIDAATAALGGCPFAPGATGNTATEDLAFAFAGGGIDTGIDLRRLLAAADRIAALPGGQSGGHLRRVPRRRALGLPRDTGR